MPPKNYEMPPGVGVKEQYFIDLYQFGVLEKKDEYRLWEEMQPWKEMRKSVSDEQLQNLSVEQQAIKSQYDEAHETLFNHNLRLVVSIAKNFYSNLINNSSLDLLDIIQDGNLGLYGAVDEFDARKGFKFSTFATSCIKSSIFKSISNKKSTIRTTAYVENAQRQLTSAKQEASHIDDPKEREEYVRELSGFSPKKIKTLEEIKVTVGTLSLSSTVSRGKDGNGRELGELLPDNTTAKEIDDFVDRELLKDLLSCSGLTDRERKVLDCRFGLSNGGEILKLKEIGKILGITSERVRQVEVLALGKLRKKAEDLSLSF